MKSKWLAVGFLLAAFLWAGCTTAQVQAVRHTATGIEPQEALVILFSPQFSLDARPIEEKEIVTCISDEVRKGQPGLRIVSPDEFRRTAFPNLAPEAAPNSPEYLDLLLNHASFRERISSLGIRYLISVRGGTEQKGEVSGGGIGGGGAAVLVIGGSWDRKTELVASVIDLKQETASGEIKASASGRPWFFAVLPSPLVLGMPAFTEAKACGELGQALAKFLAGENPSNQEEDQK
jgi:hypothetical protein